MQRIDVVSAAPVLPQPSALGTPGFFTEGDPIAGTPATIVTADFMNMIQEELISILTASGIAPAKSNYGQILAALKVLFVSQAAFAGSFGQSGYQKFSSGLILQWSFNTLLPNQALSTISFPIAFPNSAFGMVASAGALLTLGANQVGVGAGPISNTQGQIAVAANAPGQTGVYYFALGN